MNAPAVTYGFIGLGVMGFPMAANLRRSIPADSKLYVCEVNAERRQKFVAEAEREVIEVGTPRQVALNAQIIITSLPAGQHVKEVFANIETGLLSASGTGKLFIETSTIATTTSLEIHQLVTKSGMGDFIDAPVSGGPSGASTASLTFMVGGTQTLFQRAMPVLRTMGKEENIFFCGKAGAGLATKQINNYLSGVCIVGTCEAMDMGIKYGLDPRVLSNVINVSTGRNYNSKEQNPIKGVTSNAAAAKDFQGGFSIELATGVIKLAKQLGEQVGANLKVAEEVVSAFEQACQDERCRGKDCRSLYRWLANVE